MKVQYTHTKYGKRTTSWTATSIKNVHNFNHHSGCD